MAPPSISSASTVVASSRQVSTDVEGESVMLNFDEGVYYGLDRVGARIWELLQEPVTPAQIRDRIVAEYEVEPHRCEADRQDLLGELAEAGLIEVTDAKNT
jgi:Coenzyme PQQ synthesis protein D (PqqD)